MSQVLVRPALVAACLILLACYACAGTGKQPAPEHSLAGRLPGLSELSGLSHAVSSLALRNGSNFVTAGGTYSPSGTTVALAPPGGELAFAVYGFSIPSEAQVANVALACTSAASAPAWVGVSDYATGSWTFTQLGSTGGTVTLDRPAMELCSDRCIMYVVVLAFGGDLTVESISVAHNGDTLGWNHSWGTAFDEDLRYVGVDEAGSVYAVADHELTLDHSGDIAPMLLKYASDGSLVAGRLWDDPAILTDTLGVRDFMVLPDGSSYTAWVAPNSPRSIFLLKADADLNLVWCREFDPPGSASEGGLGLDNDGNIVFFAAIQPPTGDDYGMLTWLTPAGDLARQRKLTIGTASDSNLIFRRFAVEPLSGDLLAEGTRYYPTAGLGAPSLLRLASDGALKFSKVLTTPQYINISFSENGVTYDSAGNMVTTCRAPKVDMAAPSDHLMLLRTSPTGDIVAAQSLTLPGTTTINSQRIDTFSSGEPMLEFLVNLGAVQRYGCIRLSRENAAPLDWATFFDGGTDNDIAEMCGSFYLARTAGPSTSFTPVLESGDQFTLADISAGIALVDTGDTLADEPTDYLLNAAGSQLIDIAGTQDAPVDFDVLLSRFVP